ncbi:hypothetical protein [Streptomyces lydicus]|uniref:hypothetical protein n=1 Tax=Streptomyces lydicus TaxID=47763 RepID=UPI0037B28CE7
MSRASIQDKFAETSSLKAVQVLALVRAFADYAASIGAPLPPEEVDERAWLEKVARLDLDQPPRAVAPSIDIPATPPDAMPVPVGLPDLNQMIIPIRNAGMDDIVQCVEEGLSKPLENWLPAVLEALDTAAVDDHEFLHLGALAAPYQIVKIITWLADKGLENLANRYFRLCLTVQAPSHIPKLLVLLRREQSEHSYYFAEGFVDALLGVGDWTGEVRSDLAAVVSALRAAALKKDANKLAEGIGLEAWPRAALEIAGAFPLGFFGDRERILRAAARSGPRRLLSFVETLEGKIIEGIDPSVTTVFLLASIPPSQHKRYSSTFEEAGRGALAARILELQEEPPF